MGGKERWDVEGATESYGSREREVSAETARRGPLCATYCTYHQGKELRRVPRTWRNNIRGSSVWWCSGDNGREGGT